MDRNRMDDEARGGLVQGRLAREVSTPQEVVQILKAAKTLAVVGFSDDAGKPAHYVPEYLFRHGYKIIPVHPALAARKESFFGQRAVATLREILEPIDVVEIFRRSDKVAEHLEDILSLSTPPRWVWLQLGIRNDEVMAKLLERGISVVQDRCMLADHRTFL